ncbi:MFS-type transporter ppsE [Fulvia fulva]|uniref:MFS-type transporter ppsE n=1 Tax=Passalora fulva TaxID=5499 RepID=A0A9Q8PBB9_PASFU|nr:MFS-type transporter ppsE [Fulvia fulva]KAK4622138.1 MFS-type transporter ppsE [Fulvia fulva]UJO19340.1 MFS-type transporter ppsE [Fulvia fulva]WPV16057.1 MFS-type transporter ppsE [Fulvia fulva]WPV31451.1 MFS-type transporter ppsE [Fulvia fulva]
MACPTQLDLESQTPQSEKQPPTPSSLQPDECSPAYNSSTAQKCLVVFTTSFITLSASFSSTSLFSAADQIAGDFGTTAVVINASSAGVLFTMSVSTFIWGPIATLTGRLAAWYACIVALLFFTMAGALSPNLSTFIAFRVLSGFQGTFFHVTGQTILAEYFPPTSRGTATGFFLCGTVLGSPLGPLVAGVVVTYQSWRVILWVQVGMIAIGLLFSFLFLRKGCSPALIPKDDETTLMSHVVHALNPMKVLGLMKYPNVLLTDIACGLLAWSQYALLSSPRHILVSQFNLNTPLISGLFYLSPTAGFLFGTIIGGRFSDHTVRQWIKRRDGIRLPQDRLRSGFASFFFVIPAASLIFGWCIEEQVGGLAIPIVTAFFSAAGLLAALAGLNTYCAEVMPKRRSDAIASKYVVQYTFSALATATCVPMIDAIGVGWQSTISTILVLVAGGLCITVALYGINMQIWVDRKCSHGTGSEPVSTASSAVNTPTRT